MPQPDYEDDLVFPPKPEKIEDLTDDWKTGRLLCENYWVKLINGDIIVSFFNGLEFSCCKDFGIREVLAPCDYEELRRLESDRLAKIEAVEINAELEQKIQQLNQLIDSHEQTNQAMDKKLIKFFNLLKECGRRLEDLLEWSDTKYDEAEDLLTRINAAIGESEE